MVKIHNTFGDLNAWNLLENWKIATEHLNYTYMIIPIASVKQEI